MDNDCNSVALTLSRAAQTACAQAPGFCHLNTTENVRSIQILSRTETSCYGLRHARETALHYRPSGLQRGAKGDILAYLCELSVKLLSLGDLLVIEMG